MYRIALINMPFAGLHLPSIALAQLRSVLGSRFGDRVECRVLYLNMDFALFLGLDAYKRISNSVEANTAGLGDWIFRDQAFPGQPDNAAEYFQRHFPSSGVEVEMLRRQVLDRRQRLDEFLDGAVERYGLDGYDLVGFTSMFSQNAACVALARRIKERSPETVVVMGGANCETSMGAVLARRVDAVDFVFSGPSLRSFPEVVGHLLEGKEERCHKVQGVYSRRNQGLAVGGGAGQVGAELPIDVDVPIEYEDYLAALDEHFEPGTITPFILFETSRGCWWGERSHCTFCGLNGSTMAYRSMSPEQAIAQFERLFAYAPRARQFQSVDNILPREYLTDVFPRLETPEGISIFYEVKADLKPREMEVLAAARVTDIQPGVEALNTDTLKRMRKGTTAFQNLRFLQGCLVHGIDPQWNLLLGFPGEPEEVYEKYSRDLPLLVHLPPPTGAFPVRFDRFSPYYVKAEEYDLDLEPCEFYRMVYPFPAQELVALAYYFVDRNYDAPYVTRTAKWIGPLRERIARWQQRWSGEDGKLAPRLEYVRRDGGRAVYDSRNGEAVLHRLDDADTAILAALVKPATPVRLASRMKEIDAGELERRLEDLIALGLLFEERGMVMSLVVEREAGAETAAGTSPLPEQDAVEEFRFA